ncbi:hypothetical protein R6Q57_004458 [Mikania cordata]
MRPETKKLAIIALFVVMFLNFEPNQAARLLDRNMLLSSLHQHRSVPSPGNGCSNTGNGGNRCVGSRKVAGRHEGSAPPPTLIQSTLVDH